MNHLSFALFLLSLCGMAICQTAHCQTEEQIQRGIDYREAHKPNQRLRILKMSRYVEAIAEELHITDEQLRDVEKLTSKLESQRRELRSKKRKTRGPVARKEIDAEVEELIDAYEDQISEVLEKMQLARLDQLVNQFAYLNSENPAGLCTIWFHSFLEIRDSADWPQVQIKMRSLHNNFWEERLKLFDEKYEEILKVLPKEKRQKFLELVGEIPVPGQPVKIWQGPGK